ncbi:MAG: hypothetical protein J5507_00075 [Clostridia bacterium]|nr:hypothetical protein [Clostridia bacterium]
MIDFIKQNSNIKDLYINQNIIIRIIEDFKEALLKNKETFLELYKIDIEKNDRVVNIDSIIKLLDLYKNEDIEEKDKEVIIASYDGSPYVTINLCMQTLIKKRGTILVIEDSMFAVNKLLISIFNNILKEYKISKMIELYNNISLKEIKEMQDKVNYVVCIGNSYTYYKYYKEEINNLKYIPFRNLALYCDSEKFEDLKYELYKYAIRIGIEIEIYEYLEEFIECVNEDECLEYAVIFSKDENEIQECKNKIKKLKLFINENPFKNEKFKITIE